MHLAEVRRLPPKSHGNGALEDALWAIFDEACLLGDDAVANRILATVTGLKTRRAAAQPRRFVPPPSIADPGAN